MSLSQGGSPPVWPGQTTTRELAAEILGSRDSAHSASKAADWALANTETVTVASSRLRYLREQLRAQGAAQEVIDATKRPGVTAQANEVSNARVYGGRRRLQVPDGLRREAVAERLESYDTSKPRLVTVPALADVMIAVSARPAEVATMRIDADGGGVTGFCKARTQAERPYLGLISAERAADLLDWVQCAIESHIIADPKSSKPLGTYLRNEYGLVPSDLRKIGAELAVRESGAETDAERNHARKVALRHADAFSPSASDHYAIVTDD